MEYTLVLVWLVAFAALTAAATPLAALLLAPLPDRGSGLGVPLALAVVGFVGYWVGQIAFGWPALLAAILVLVGGSAVALRRGYAPDRDPAVEAFVVFAVGFLLVVAIRAADAAVDPYAGEKLLDHGLLATLTRTSALPPEDMWYAGERVQYYYGGHMIAAQLGRLTATAPAYAYNLALAGFYGATVAGAYGLGRSIAVVRGIDPRRAGVLAAFFVGIASNVSTPVRGLLLLGRHLQRPIAFDGPVDVLLAPFRALFLLVPDGLFRVVEGSTGEPVVRLFGYEFSGLALSADGFGYWDASRVIPGTINEFPLFAYLNGDLHAHMMSPPLLLLAAAVAFAYWRTPETATWRRRASLFVVAPALAALIAVVNTWSYPAVPGIIALTTAFAAAHPATVLPASVATRIEAVADASRLHHEATRLLTGGAIAVAVGILGAVFALPFFTGATSGQHPALLPDRSGLVGLLLVHGAFLVVTVAYAADRARLRRDSVETGLLVGLLALIAVANLVVSWLGASLVVVAVAGVLAAAALADPWRDRALVALGTLALVAFAAYHGSTVAFVAAGGAALFALTAAAFRDDPPRRRGVAGLATGFAVLTGISWVIDAMVLVVVLPILVAAAVLLRVDRDVGFEAVLVLCATGLVTLVEFVYVFERAGPGRLNTVFKLYWQVWVFWSVAGGVMLADVASRGWPHSLSLPVSQDASEAAAGRPTAPDGGGPDDGSPTREEMDGQPTQAGPATPGTTDATTGSTLADRLQALSLGRTLQVGSTLAAVLLVASLSLYGAFALGGHFQANPSPHWQCTQDEVEPGDADWTLNGKDWTEECYPDQHAAIAWLNERDGRPVVVEAPTTGTYLYGANDPASGLVSGVSSHTGLPTIAGWAHAANYHTQDGWNERVGHVETIYQTTDAGERAALLRQYDVTYIYVGPNERSRYDVHSLADDPGIERVDTWGEVVVYVVDQDALAANRTAT